MNCPSPLREAFHQPPEWALEGAAAAAESGAASRQSVPTRGPTSLVRFKVTPGIAEWRMRSWLQETNSTLAVPALATASAAGLYAGPNIGPEPVTRGISSAVAP